MFYFFLGKRKNKLLSRRLERPDLLNSLAMPSEITQHSLPSDRLSPPERYSSYTPMIHCFILCIDLFPHICPHIVRNDDVLMTTPILFQIANIVSNNGSNKVYLNSGNLLLNTLGKKDATKSKGWLW